MDNWNTTTTTNTSLGGWPLWQQHMQSNFYSTVYIPQTPPQEKPMRSLFNVVVVNPESGEILKDEKIVAKDQQSAITKVMRDVTGDHDDYDICVQNLGGVRAKKEVQEVKIVEK